jgi:hypothetical protein
MSSKTSHSYAKLGNYNQGQCSNMGNMQAPIAKPQVGYYVVPEYSAPGYSTLSGKYNSGNKYFTIDEAYPCSSYTSTKYAVSQC